MHEKDKLRKEPLKKPKLVLVLDELEALFWDGFQLSSCSYIYLGKSNIFNFFIFGFPVMGTSKKYQFLVSNFKCCREEAEQKNWLISAVTLI